MLLKCFKLSAPTPSAQWCSCMSKVILFTRNAEILRGHSAKFQVEMEKEEISMQSCEIQAVETVSAESLSRWKVLEELLVMT